jgi:hypothetical protein
MATTYSSTFYTSTGAVKDDRAMSSGNAGGLHGASFSETIATTVTDGLDEHYMQPAPANGNRRLQGFLLQGGDMDAGGPTLDADIVFRTVLDGVVTDTMIYDSSVSGLFSAALALKYVHSGVLLPQSDSGTGHFVFKVNTAATTPAAANLTFVPLVS